MSRNLNSLLINLSPHFALISFVGKEVSKFLQGQFTCDLRQVTEQRSSLGAYCNVKGRVIATFRIFCFRDNFYLILPRSMLEKFATTIQRYAALSKITIVDVSENFFHFGILQEDYSKNLQATVAANSDHALMTIAPNRYQMLGPIENYGETFRELSEKLSLNDVQIWQLCDIQAGIPHILPETSELFTPHMLNYPELQGVSFNKGCYIGQEIIAKTEYLGKSKRHLCRGHIRTHTAPSPGDKLISSNGVEIGNLVNSNQVAHDDYAVLIVLLDEALNEEIFWCSKTENEKNLKIQLFE